jgi:hypothetical protein
MYHTITKAIESMRNEMKFTLQELATKTHCSLRLIESNLSDKKEELLKESLIEFDGKTD